MTYLFDTIYFSISLSTHTLTKLYKSAFAFKLKHRISVSLSQEKIQKSVADLFDSILFLSEKMGQLVLVIDSSSAMCPYWHDFHLGYVIPIVKYFRYLGL